MQTKRSGWMMWGGILILSGLIVGGCTTNQGNDGNVVTYSVPQNGEAIWIRNGEPIEFDGDLWYPYDEVDILLDAEVDPAGEYRGVQFFVEKTDVRPYNQLYTKFARNKFRIFKNKRPQ